MTGLARTARVLSVALIASSAIFAIGLLLTSATDGTGALFLPIAGAFAVIAVLLTLAQPEVHRLLLRQLVVHREAFYVGTLLVGTSVALAHYGLAAVALQYGPNARGDEFLLTASGVAVLTAVIAASAQVVLAGRGAPRIRERVVALALLAAATAIPVAAMWLLGRSLDPRPLDQPAALGTLVLAMRSVGAQLVVVPAAFTAATALVPLVAWVRSRVVARRSAPPQARRSDAAASPTGPIPAR